MFSLRPWGKFGVSGTARFTPGCGRLHAGRRVQPQFPTVIYSADHLVIAKASSGPDVLLEWDLSQLVKSLRYLPNKQGVVKEFQGPLPWPRGLKEADDCLQKAALTDWEKLRGIAQLYILNADVRRLRKRIKKEFPECVHDECGGNPVHLTVILASVQSDLAKEIQAAAPLLREIYVEVLSREELTGDKSDVWKRGHNGHKVVQITRVNIDPSRPNKAEKTALHHFEASNMTSTVTVGRCGMILAGKRSFLQRHLQPVHMALQAHGPSVASNPSILSIAMQLIPLP